jgi:hypothetical protein
MYSRVHSDAIVIRPVHFSAFRNRDVSHSVLLYARDNQRIINFRRFNNVSSMNETHELAHAINGSARENGEKSVTHDSISSTMAEDTQSSRLC